ncbi:MAG: ribonuclease P protein subunit [Candidatus Hodarchaeota archaeon]
MISPKYLIYHDLIGFQVYAKIKSKTKNLEFKDIGIVIDDTQNMLITKKKERIRNYIKKNYIFRFDLGRDMLEVNGLKIVGLPENRLRSLKKKKWLRK